MKSTSITSFIFAILFMMAVLPAKAYWGSESLTMTVGETKTLYLPSPVINLAPTSVSFYSASYQIVRVDSYNNYSVKVTALQAYSSPVVVRCDFYYYQNGFLSSGAYDYNITVKAVEPQSVSLPSSRSVYVGDFFTLVPTVTPANAQTTFTWSSSNSSIASVTQSGRVTGMNPGTATITVRTANGKSASCQVKVMAVNVPGDVDNNGVVGIDDVTALIDLLLKGNTTGNPSADVDGNGSVTIDDVTALIDRLLGSN